ncbi:hypothetical protein LOCC1_G008020 [Lachnellula occidentalis]|uniref:Uncharacterized protein n=1 Tax=Lachnellula occidentalis TaxID=215460 RepID=A0A8H8RLD6_9HELO|nr:hypothetical protein LOCC1_G008020 [Lachnellula occidentalis]
MKWFKRASTPKSEDVHASDKANYSLLRESSDGSQSSDNELGITPVPKPKSKVHSYLILLGKAVLIAFAFLGIYSVARSALLKPNTHKPVSCSCGGTTVAEAISRGCVFTPLALGWLPPQCLDMELSDEFDKLGPLAGGEWPYWSDLNGTTRITREEMGLLADVGGLFYTTQEWHVMHCM